jgi:hypothetical protein
VQSASKFQSDISTAGIGFFECIRKPIVFVRTSVFGLLGTDCGLANPCDCLVVVQLAWALCSGLKWKLPTLIHAKTYSSPTRKSQRIPHWFKIHSQKTNRAFWERAAAVEWAPKYPAVINMETHYYTKHFRLPLTETNTLSSHYHLETKVTIFIQDSRDAGF